MAGAVHNERGRAGGNRHGRKAREMRPPMRTTIYPFEDVQCVCGWDDDGSLTLTPVEPDPRYEDYEPAPVVSVTVCGRCGCELLPDTVVPRRAPKPLPARTRVRKPIRDRRHRCARAGVAV